jgi:hypothetical protein
MAWLTDRGLGGGGGEGGAGSEHRKAKNGWGLGYTSHLQRPSW